MSILSSDSFPCDTAENWRPVILPNTREKSYEVSDLGRVRTTKTHRVLVPSRKKAGGYTVMLTCYLSAPMNVGGIETGFVGKYFLRRSLSKMVADTFIPNPDNLPCIGYVDGDPRNCAVSNLRRSDYVRSAEAIGKNHAAKMLAEDHERRMLADDAEYWRGLSLAEQQARYARHLADGYTPSQWPAHRVFRSDGEIAPVKPPVFPPTAAPIPAPDISESAIPVREETVNMPRLNARELLMTDAERMDALMRAINEGPASGHNAPQPPLDN